MSRGGRPGWSRLPSPTRELAERLRCDPSNVTFLVDRLEERHLASGPAEAGIDASRCSLTPAGVEVRSRLTATLAESPIFTGLTSAQ